MTSRRHDGAVALGFDGAGNKEEREFWKGNAQRLRAAARETADSDYRAAALQVANLYERIAGAAEPMQQYIPSSGPQPATFEEAFDAAVASFGAEQWDNMLPAQQSAAIYVEMRRIDAVRFAVAEPMPPFAAHALPRHGAGNAASVAR